MLPTSQSRTDIGLYRQRNEDRLLARDDLGLWAVCDGLGGLVDGDKAAQRVVDALAALPAAGQPDETAIALRAAIDAANAAIFAEAEAAGMRSGTTLAAMALCEGQALVAWCGDSRVYRLRAGALRLLTRDHTVANELVAAGLSTPAEAAAHPDGLHGEISEAGLIAALTQQNQPKPDALKHAVTANGARDNLSFVLVQF